MIRQIDPLTASFLLKDNDAGLLFPVGYGSFYAEYDGDEVLGIGELSITNTSAKSRTLYVFPHARRRGVATRLVRYRIALARNMKWVKVFRADCLSTSLQIYLREGAVVKRICKNGVHKVELSLRNT